MLSHFHKDHAGSLDLVNAENLYVSGETFRHVGRGSIVSSALVIGNIRIFPLPSSHAKGCLGLEVEGEYAFVGDAVYCRSKNGRRFYNAQLLRDEIAVLKTLRAPYLLLSHRPGLLRPREEVIAMLETVYGMRRGDDPDIYI